MDNAEIDIRCEGDEALQNAISIFMGGWLGGRRVVSHWAEVQAGSTWKPNMGDETTVVHETAPTLILYWTDPVAQGRGMRNELGRPKVRKFRGTVTAQKAHKFVKEWLDNVPQSQYAEWIDHDGSMGKGFRIWNEAWTHVGGSWAGVFAVRPVHAWYGK